MATCFNCRQPLYAPLGQCPSCGARPTLGWPRALSDGLGARDGGWGLPTDLHGSRWFRMAGLLSPLWVPLVLFAVAFVMGPGIFALAVLGATVIFVPGVLTIANHPPWPRLVRFVACLLYVALAEFVYLGTFHVAAKVLSGA